MRRARLRIAVPPWLTDLPPSTGRGRLWSNLLPRLAGRARLEVIEPSPSRSGRRRPRPDVWLGDGHQGPLLVEGPTVMQLHEAAWSDPATRHLLHPDFVSAYEASSRDGARAATRVVTPSESSRRQVIGCYGVDPGRVTAVPHGVDLHVFRPGAAPGRALVAHHRGSFGHPYIVFVSSLHPRKNLAAARGALTLLADRGFPHHLVVVYAPAPDRADSGELERQALAELPGWPGRVHGLSHLTEADLAGVMAGADAFCLPSLMEGFGLTALEAMACGLPVFVAGSGALPEVVGDGGVVTEPTAEAMAGAMASVLADPDRREARAAAARRRALSFSWEATTAGWLGVLTAAAEEGAVASGLGP